MILKWYKVDFGTTNAEVNCNNNNKKNNTFYQSSLVKLCKINAILFIFQLLGWIIDHLPDGLKKQQLKELVEQPRSVKVKFCTYNWDLNS